MGGSLARPHTHTQNTYTRTITHIGSRGCTQAQFRGLNGAAACSTPEWRSRNVVPRLSSTREHRRFERAATFSPSRRARRVPGGVRGRSTQEGFRSHSRGPLLRTLSRSAQRSARNYVATKHENAAPRTPSPCDSLGLTETYVRMITLSPVLAFVRSRRRYFRSFACIFRNGIVRREIVCDAVRKYLRDVFVRSMW